MFQGKKRFSLMFLLIVSVSILSLILGACKPKAPEAVETKPEQKAEVQEPVETKPAQEQEAEVQEKEPEPEAETGEITIWAWDENANVDMMESFMEQHPGITVKQETIMEYEDTFFSSLVAGAGLPDAAWMDSHSYQKMARTGQLMPLDDYIAPYKDDIMPSLLEGATVNGHIYGVPRRFAPQVLWYRKDRFKEVGIDPASLKTWDDFIREGKKAVTDDEHFMTCADPVYVPFIVEAMLFSKEGTGYYDANDNVTVNSPENVALLSKYVEMVDLGLVKLVSGWEPDWYDALDNAKCASYVIPYWFASDPMNDFENPANEGNWGMLPIPSLDPSVEENHIIWQGPLYWVIPAKAKNPDLAWKFVEYNSFAYEDPVVQASFDEEFVLPAYQKFYEIDYPFLPEAMDYYGFNMREVAIELSTNSPVTYMPPEFNESGDILGGEIYKVLEGEQTVQEALDSAARQFQELLDAR